jgi:ABC-type transport system involved in cytochrome bd biosynthesis fused ATPase/permease subunit
MTVGALGSTSGHDTDPSLSTVRSVISIVPQSPDLFEGTLRENIDPVGEYQDADIWAALEHVRIYPYTLCLFRLTEPLLGSFEVVRREP